MPAEDPQFQITELAPAAVKLEGSLTAQNSDLFASQLSDLRFEEAASVSLDMSGLDIEGGLALATLLNVLRKLRGRSAGLSIRGAPQILGHNLYRVGLLGGAKGIELLDMREDEPAAS